MRNFNLDVCKDLDALEDTGKQKWGWEITDAQTGDLIDLSYGYDSYDLAERVGEKELKKFNKA